MRKSTNSSCHRFVALIVVALTVSGWITLGACVPAVPVSDSPMDIVLDVLGTTPDDPTDPTTDPTTDSTESTTESTANNDSFSSAQTITLSDAGQATLSGEILTTTDIDLYDLGAVDAGDTIVAEVSANNTFDPMGALFDEGGLLRLHNDDRNFFGGDLDVLLSLVVTEATDHCYLAVTTSSAALGTGSYTATITVSRGAATPTTQAQSIVLDFDGQNIVSIGGGAAINVPVFDASAISDRYSGQSEAMIEIIVAEVKNDFDGLNVSLRTSAEAVAEPTSESVVYFGTFNASLLGLADNVDAYNADSTQLAIVYTETFRLFESLNASVDQMAQVIANVASHEIGHLLGLYHTNDPTGLMDVTATASQLLVDQKFRISPLAPEIFAIGSQSGIDLLLATVGASGSSTASTLRAKALIAARAPAPLEGEMSLPKSMFVSCFCKKCVAYRIKSAARQ